MIGITGLTSVTFRKKTAEEVVKIVKDCCLEAIEWGADIHAPPDASPERLAVIRECCDKTGIRVHSYGSYWRAGENNVFKAEQVVRAATALGASCIRVWTGSKGSADVSPEKYERLVADLNGICGIAGKYGIRVAIEFHKGTYSDCAKSALRLLGDCPGLRTYWQENPEISFEQNLEELTALLPALENVHVFYFDAALNRYPLRERESCWNSYLKVIDAAKNSVGLLFEFVRDDSESQLREDSETLLKIIRRKF